MKNIFIIFLLGIIGIGVAGCDEDCEDITNPECPNFDPCYGVEDVPQATIEVGRTLFTGPNSPDIRYSGDTILYGGVYFKTNISNAIRYEWTVGTDNRTWNTKEFELNFPDTDSLTLRNNPIQVRLIVEYETNACFPENNGIDTVYKTIHFRAYWENKIEGTWEGYRDNLVDNVYQLEIRIDRTIDPQLPFPHPLDDVLFIDNQYGLNTGCFHWYSSFPNFLSYRNLYDNFQQGYAYNWETCGGPYYRWNRELDITVNTTDDTMVMTWKEWKYKDDGDCCESIPHIFRGSRVD
jgi:hypothetical protein